MSYNDIERTSDVSAGVFRLRGLLDDTTCADEVGCSIRRYSTLCGDNIYVFLHQNKERKKNSVVIMRVMSLSTALSHPRTLLGVPES